MAQLSGQGAELSTEGLNMLLARNSAPAQRRILSRQIE